MSRIKELENTILEVKRMKKRTNFVYIFCGSLALLGIVLGTVNILYWDKLVWGIYHLITNTTVVVMAIVYYKKSAKRANLLLTSINKLKFLDSK